MTSAILPTGGTPRVTVDQPGPLGFILPEYFIIEPSTGDRMYACDTLGEQLGAGAVMADLFAQATEGNPCPPERCRTCAFRRGTQANGSAQTLGTALGCLMDGDTFGCHHHKTDMFGGSNGHVCQGFAAIRDSGIGETLRHVHATGKTISEVVDEVLAREGEA